MVDTHASYSDSHAMFTHDAQFFVLGGRADAPMYLVAPH